MAQNLNYKAEGSECYDYQPVNCSKYGRLYNWSTAIKACPEGWHLPSNAEWNVLMKYVNPNCQDNSICAGVGTKLKATDGWEEGGNGPDNYGFSALPSGSRFYSNWAFLGKGYGGSWWSFTEGNANFLYLPLEALWLLRLNQYKQLLFVIKILHGKL